jgi:hypothetical protein
MKLPWQNLRRIPYLSGGNKKEAKSLVQDGRSQGHNLNHKPLQFKAGVLTIYPRRLCVGTSVSVLHFGLLDHNIIVYSSVGGCPHNEENIHNNFTAVKTLNIFLII